MRSGKAAPQNLAFVFELRQSGFDDVEGKGEAAGELARGGGADRIHPASKNAGGFDSRVLGEFQTFRRGPKASHRCRPRAFDGAGPAGANQLIVEAAPLRHRRKHDQREQRVVQLIGVANHGPGFGGHLRDGLGVERSQASGVLGPERPPQLHRAGAALLERRVVEEGVGIRVQDLVAERRGLARVDGDGFERAVRDALQDLLQALPDPWPHAGSCRWFR